MVSYQELHGSNSPIIRRSRLCSPLSSTALLFKIKLVFSVWVSVHTLCCGLPVEGRGQLLGVGTKSVFRGKKKFSSFLVFEVVIYVCFKPQ